MAKTTTPLGGAAVAFMKTVDKLIKTTEVVIRTHPGTPVHRYAVQRQGKARAEYETARAKWLS